LELQRDHVIGKPHREKDSLDDELLIDANKQKDEPGEDESRSSRWPPTPNWTR